MTIGLALSGGGARGVAHLGAIKALEEAGIKIDQISGTSAGAIIGGMYAYGLPVEEILQAFIGIKPFRFLQPALTVRGFLKIDVLYKYLSQYITENSFDHLQIPLAIASTNVRTGETEYFREGLLIEAMCASSCIPVLFDPYAFNNELYIDGGILNNLPAEALKGRCDYIIGSHSNVIDDDFQATNFSNVTERALMLAITRNVVLSKELCDLIIEPVDLKSFKVMDISKVKDIYGIGYQAAKEQIKSLKTLIK